jgi:hypothetical protein
MAKPATFGLLSLILASTSVALLLLVHHKDWGIVALVSGALPAIPLALAAIITGVRRPKDANAILGIILGILILVGYVVAGGFVFVLFQVLSHD